MLPTPSCPASLLAGLLLFFPLVPIFASLVFFQFLKVLLSPELDLNIRYRLRRGFGYPFVPNPALQGATVNFKNSRRFRYGVFLHDYDAAWCGICQAKMRSAKCNILNHFR